MRVAAFYAGLTFNALFLLHTVQVEWRWANPVSLVLGPFVWGLFLLFAVYLVPARTGMGPRELLEAQFGRWASGFVWWIWLPLWVVSWFDFLTHGFAYTAHAPFLRWEEMGRLSVDTQVAVHWPWIVLTGLAGLAPVEKSGFSVRIAAAILLAAPFAYWREWPAAARSFESPSCCLDIWGMQDLTLWLAPAILFAGRFRERSLRHGFTGVSLAVAVAATAAYLTYAGAAADSVRVAKTGNYLVAAAGAGEVGGIKMLLLSLTLLAAGRFCAAVLGERLGVWRRLWVVFPLTATLVWGVRYWPAGLPWQMMSMPFLALAGAMSAGYLRRRSFAFDTAEQRLAAMAAISGGVFGVVAYHNHYSAPFLTWLAGFVLTSALLQVRTYLKVAVATPLR